MKIQSILLLVVSIMLVVVSAWNLGVFIRLGDASDRYPNDDQFNIACHVSKKYVKTGKIVSTLLLVLSTLLMIGGSVIMSKNHV
jgi:hypothetical protein